VTTLAALLMTASAAIMLLLGLVHLLYTFHGPKLHASALNG
jgi:succinate dehydrogenase hydrophobic anchor subunit